MDRKHDFIPYPSKAFQSCLRCGRRREHPIHKPSPQPSVAPA